MKYQLSANEMIILEGIPAGVFIKCEQGVIWITQTGMLADHILSDGEAFHVENSVKTAIMGQQESTVMFEGINSKDNYRLLVGEKLMKLVYKKRRWFSK